MEVKKSFSAYTLKNLSRALNVEADYILLGEMEEPSHGALSRETLLCVQRMLMEVYNEIQDLIDG